MDKYTPPYTITTEMLNRISIIMEIIGKLDNYSNFCKMPILRKNNRIHSIHSSLAIEDNNLTIKEVKDVINGKMVMGPKKDIQEVKNAYKAYNMINKINPYNINDLLKIHGVLTYLTIEESGTFRKGNEGVFDENGNCIFIAPKADLVPKLMNDLFIFINENKNKIHPLILSSIFHYEFVFIHGFSDGNGRTARLWQNAMLSKWKPLFEYVPIETQLKKYQNDYYKVINDCNNKGDSTLFIEFMLKMINEVLEDLTLNASTEINNQNSNINKLLDVMEYNVPLSANEIMNKLSLKSKESFRDNYLNPAIEFGLIKMTLPDKRTSKNQKYYKD